MTRFSDIVETARKQRESADGDRQADASAGAEEETVSADDGLDEPAFPFAEAVQEQIYPRSGTYEQFEDFRDFDLKRELRDRGLRDVSGRELDDALLRLAMAHGEEYADLVVEARR